MTSDAESRKLSPMNRNFLLTLSLVLAASFLLDPFSDATEPSDSPSKPSAIDPGKGPQADDPGKIDGWNYHQDYFGIFWKIPEDAAIRGRGWSKHAIHEGLSELMDKPTVSAVESSAAGTIMLVTLDLDSTLPKKKGDDSVLLMSAAERIPEAAAIRTGVDYLENTRNIIKATMGEPQLARPVYKETIGGQTFDAVDFVVHVATGTPFDITETLFSAIHGPYALLISAIYPRPEGLTRAHAILKSLQFSESPWTKAPTLPEICTRADCSVPKPKWPHTNEGQAGIKSYRANDYAKSLELFQKAAAKGDLEAEGNLGYQIQMGNGTPVDFKRAAELYRHAAQGGEGWSAARLGWLYLNGKGVPMDRAEAARWFRKGARLGNSWAQEYYAVHLVNGDGVEKNLTEAAYWRRKAAFQGDLDAMYLMAMAYGVGAGVERSDFEAMAWLRVAASRGSIDALNKLGDLTAQGQGMPRDPEMALRYFQRAAELGDAEGQFKTGLAYKNGEGTKADPVSAYVWLTLAQSQKMTSADEPLLELAKSLSKDQLAEANRRLDAIRNKK